MRRFRATVLLVALLVTGCGEDSGAGGGIRSAAGDSPAADFAQVRAEAKGQTVRWWLYGGDQKVNDYVDDEVVPELAKLGVELKRVPVDDTAEAVKRVVSERRAGKDSGGGVDLIWINGENFASGKEAGLWLEDWATDLPNARKYVDFEDPAIAEDFQVPVDGQESPWQRAAFVYAYDSARISAPPRTFDDLLAYAQENPGRFTYPAPPDFTGSAFVRQVIAAMGEDEGFAYLRKLKPLMYESGNSLPKSQAELDELFANRQVDFAMAYDAGFVNSGVRRGAFPKTTRPFLLEGGALQNTSYVTIPANAANRAGALVLADLLLSPELQAAKADPESLGNPTVLDPDQLGAKADLFDRQAASPYVLDDFGTPVPEFAADRVPPLEQRWTSEVLR